MTEVKFKAQLRRGVIAPFPGVAGRVAVELARFPMDATLDVTVSLPGKKRTLKQNARHWDLIVPAFEQLGHEVFSQWAELHGMTPKDSAHNVIKAMFLDRLKIELPNGEVVEVLPSSAKLTTAQFSQMDERAERYLNNLDPPVYLPAKEDL